MVWIGADSSALATLFFKVDVIFMDILINMKV